MENPENETKWFSINIDDSTSDLMPSFESAVNDKSLYIIEQSHYYSSNSGKTDYNKYDVYSIDGEKTQLKIGNCKIMGSITEDWMFASSFFNILYPDSYSKVWDIFPYPPSWYVNDSIYCSLVIFDINGYGRKIAIHNFKQNIWNFIKEFSRIQIWERFILSHWLKIIREQVDLLDNFTLKYGYSKQEFSYEYLYNTGIDAYERRFKDELNRIDYALEFCIKMISSKYIKEYESEMKAIRDKCVFISQILEGKKPWRR